MDFKGPRHWQGAVGPLSVIDDHSRYAIALRGTWCTQAEPVKQQLIAAFERSLNHTSRLGMERLVFLQE